MYRNSPFPTNFFDFAAASSAANPHFGSASYSNSQIMSQYYEQMSMDDQERKKLDRKRARNRQAATKCRQKKMDRIRELEEQVSSEKARSARLNNELSQLQSVLNAYRDAVTTHQNRGCRAS